jgi:hypothetical protein
MALSARDSGSDAGLMDVEARMGRGESRKRCGENSRQGLRNRIYVFAMPNLLLEDDKADNLRLFFARSTFGFRRKKNSLTSSNEHRWSSFHSMKEQALSDLVIWASPCSETHARIKRRKFLTAPAFCRPFPAPRGASLRVHALSSGAGAPTAVQSSHALLTFDLSLTRSRVGVAGRLIEVQAGRTIGRTTLCELPDTYIHAVADLLSGSWG